MKKIILFPLIFSLLGCMDYTWEKPTVWVSKDKYNSFQFSDSYCVLFKPEGWKDMRGNDTLLKCGLPIQAATKLRDEEAVTLGAVAQ